MGAAHPHTIFSPDRALAHFVSRCATLFTHVGAACNDGGVPRGLHGPAVIAGVTQFVTDPAPGNPLGWVVCNGGGLGERSNLSAGDTAQFVADLLRVRRACHAWPATVALRAKEHIVQSAHLAVCDAPCLSFTRGAGRIPGFTGLDDLCLHHRGGSLGRIFTGTDSCDSCATGPQDIQGGPRGGYRSGRSRSSWAFPVPGGFDQHLRLSLFQAVQPATCVWRL